MAKATTSAPPMTFRAEVHDVVAELLDGRAEVRAGQMMGLPAFFTHSNNKMFAGIYGEGMFLKLPPARIDELLAERPHDVSPFTPGRGTMQGWVQIDYGDPDEAQADAELLDEALAFVQSQPKKGR